MLLRKDDSLLLLIDVQEKLTPKILNAQSMISHCQWLLKLAQKVKVPVLVSEQYSKGLGSTLKELSSCIEPFSPVEKIHFSSFQCADFKKHIEKSNKQQLILIGIEAHVCVLQTAMELHSAGYEVYVVVDAVGSRKEEDFKYGLKRLKQAGISLITAEMVFFEWLRRADIPDFKQLSKEFL